MKEKGTEHAASNRQPGTDPITESYITLCFARMAALTHLNTASGSVPTTTTMRTEPLGGPEWQAVSYEREHCGHSWFRTPE